MLKCFDQTSMDMTADDVNLTFFPTVDRKCI